MCGGTALDQCHTCDFVLWLCPATLCRDKVTVCNCEIAHASCKQTWLLVTIFLQVV